MSDVIASAAQLLLLTLSNGTQVTLRYIQELVSGTEDSTLSVLNNLLGMLNYKAVVIKRKSSKYIALANIQKNPHGYLTWKIATLQAMNEVYDEPRTELTSNDMFGGFLLIRILLAVSDFAMEEHGLTEILADSAEPPPSCCTSFCSDVTADSIKGHWATTIDYYTKLDWLQKYQRSDTKKTMVHCTSLGQILLTEESVIRFILDLNATTSEERVADHLAKYKKHLEHVEKL